MNPNSGIAWLKTHRSPAGLIKIDMQDITSESGAVESIKRVFEPHLYPTHGRDPKRMYRIHAKLREVLWMQPERTLCDTSDADAAGRRRE